MSIPRNILTDLTPVLKTAQCIRIKQRCLDCGEVLDVWDKHPVCITCIAIWHVWHGEDESEEVR